MPQELHVLRCYSCQAFQVHIVKKSNKWQCKMCGEKQSLKKIYGRGSGRDCRLHVQRLNEMRMKEKGLEKQNFPFQEECNEGATPVSCVLEDKARYNAGEFHFLTSHCSKWSRFLDGHGQDLEESDDAVTFSSVVSQSQIISKTLTNTNMAATEEESEVKKQTLHSQLLNSSKQETAFYDGSNKIFHTDMDSAFLHKNEDICQRGRRQKNVAGSKRTENYVLFEEENEQDELWNREDVGNPSLEVQQGNNTDSLGGNNTLMQQPIDTFYELQHGPVHCSNVGIYVKLQKHYCPEPALSGSEDELDKILRF